MVSGKTTQYSNGFQYVDGILQFVPTAEGYYDFTQQRYVYNLKDHLGNNRISFYHNPTTQKLEILNESHYYPFGMEQDNPRFAKNTEEYKYKYNAKEYQDELSLDWYDYGARNYDASLGRWMNVDPLAENGRRCSPYNYAVNNPIRFIDPDGMAVDDVIFNSIDEHGNKTELGRIVTDAFDQEINIDQKVLPFDVPENFEPVTVDLDANEMANNGLEITGIQAFSFDVSGEAALKLGVQVEVSLIGIVAGENKGDYGVTLQGNGLVGLEGSSTGSVSAYWSLNGQDLSLGNLRGVESGVQGSVFGVAGSYFEGLNIKSSYPFIESVYKGVSLGGSLNIPELGGSGSGYIGVSDFIYRSDNR